MISKIIAQKVLNLALETGADFAEIYLEETLSSNIIQENGKVETINSGITYGAGIRLLKDFQSVYGYTNDLSAKGLSNLAITLSKSFNGSRIKTVSEIKKVRVPNRHKGAIPLGKVSKDEKIALLDQAYEVISKYDARIVRTQVSFRDSTRLVTIFNSEGKELHDERSRGRIYIIAVASENGKIETGTAGPGAQKGLEFFTTDINIEEIAETVAKRAILMLNAEECPSGQMPVIIDNGFGGVIFHEACGHGLEATSVSKNLSVFAGKLGQIIASPLVTAIDDGTITNGWGSSNIDDEGNPTQKNVLIEKGVLKSYLIDNFNGRRMNMVGNGATRRESYRYEPTSRMSNTYIANGKSTPEEIIANTTFGLYAKCLGGGSVNSTTGDFNFACLEAYIIKDGKIAYPVKGATLIGNGADVLMKIDMVGNNLRRDQGECGSISGYIPTDVGQPMIRVKELTVGGRGGSIK